MNEDAQLVAEGAILNEAATVVRSPDRSEDAELESLVRQHSRMVYRIAYAVLRSHHDAEDAAQETFLRVLRYRHKLANVENGKTWLARIAWRVAVDRSQQRGRRREIALDDPEKPVGETASSEFPAHEVVHGSQVGELLEIDAERNVSP